MDEIERLKLDLREGRLDPERLVALMVAQQRRLQEAYRRIEELEKRLGGTPPAKLAASFSLRAEEQRQEARGKKRRKRKKSGRRGRFTTAEKIAQAQRVEKVFPAGVARSDCQLSHTRPLWRLENGQAVLVAYEVYRGPRNQFGEIPGALGRSEFGLEIILAIAYQVYIVGLSFDKVCLLMNFFQNLRLRKSQANALMNQLARHWAGEFERLCTLLANAAVVHADETGWSLRSVWAFLSEQARVLFFGVHKDAETLQQILDPATFAGILISDDAAVYAKFTHAQKCWAHLLRKAIKLTLLAPQNAAYREFTDRLLEIYRAACRVQSDGRLGDAGRLRKVESLNDEVFDLAAGTWLADLPKLEGPDDDYRLLCNELMRLLLAEQLFTFVTAPPVVAPHGAAAAVAGTNNESERTLRGAAQARKTGRTNKTYAGARRQTIVTSVLESLRQYLSSFTLSTVIGEVLRWQRAGRSCFARLMARRKLVQSAHSILDALLPVPAD